MMFSIKGLDHIVLVVSDMEISLDFYINKLGCQLIRKLETPELYQLQAGVSLIDLKPGVREHANPNVDHFCLVISPFEPEMLISFLKREEIPHGSIERRFGAGGFGDSIYIEDPDGNCIELKSA